MKRVILEENGSNIRFRISTAGYDADSSGPINTNFDWTVAGTVSRYMSGVVPAASFTAVKPTFSVPDQIKDGLIWRAQIPLDYEFIQPPMIYGEYKPSTYWTFGNFRINELSGEGFGRNGGFFGMRLLLTSTHLELWQRWRVSPYPVNDLKYDMRYFMAWI